MKTQKVTQKAVIGTVTKAVGLLVGFMASGAVSAAADNPAQPMQRTIARVAIAGAGGYGAAAVKDDGGLGTIAKYAGLGVLAREGYGLATDALKKNYSLPADANIAQRAYAGAIGLACAGDSYDNYTRATMPSLNMPQIIETVYDEGSQSFQANPFR